MLYAFHYPHNTTKKLLVISAYQMAKYNSTNTIQHHKKTERWRKTSHWWSFTSFLERRRSTWHFLNISWESCSLSLSCPIFIKLCIKCSRNFSSHSPIWCLSIQPLSPHLSVSPHLQTERWTPCWARRTVLWPTLRCDFCPPTPVFMVWAPEGWHISSSGSHCFAFIIAACGGVISGWWWRLWDCLSVGLLWCYKRCKVWLNTHFTALDGVKEFGCSYWLDVEGKLLVYWEINSTVIGGFLKALRRTLYIKWTWYLWHVS